MNKFTAISLLSLTIGAAAMLNAEPAATQPADKVVTETGLTIITVARADEASAGAKTGDHIWVHYAGRLENGFEFDNSYKKGAPIDIDLGAGRVIAGWEQGLVGMKIGEKRQLIIPAKLGWGDRGAGGGDIPPNSVTIFDVELMGILRK